MDFSLHPITKSQNRQSQANVAQLFRDNASKFFQSRFPEFHMTELMIRGVPLDVLVIQDTAYKPYHLVERYKKLHPGRIYTRVCDTNIPVAQTAPPDEIERMWRERFGLHLSPLERAKLYFLSPEDWSPLVGSGLTGDFFHTSFPEFTIRAVDAPSVVACNEEWTQGEIRKDNNTVFYFDIQYHQTRIARVRCVVFDDRKKSMVAPCWEPRRRGRLYYYDSDSIGYAVHRFQFARYADHSQRLQIAGDTKAAREARLIWTRGLQIPVVRPGVVEEFLADERDVPSESPVQDSEQQYELFLRNQIDFHKWRQNAR